MVSILATGPSCLCFDSQHSWNLFGEKIVDVADVNPQRCLEESGQWLENVDQTQISEASTQIHTLQEQIKQSEMNLAAQKEVTRAQVEGATFEAIQSAKREHLELLASDTGMDLEEMDTGRIQS